VSDRLSDKGKTGEFTTSWARQLDDRLTWVWSAGHQSPAGQFNWWPGLDQQITDFHARYERACIED